MKILKLEWRNIFSYGDDITTIEFGDKAELWQLSGISGAGKSSLIAIPKLLLFGKTEGSDGKPISVNDIANRINQKGWIRGTISKNNSIYIVERTFSPSGLFLMKDGECLDQAGLKNMQNIIDNEILDGLPYHIFSNVMTLSLNNFKSFISMTPADKRLIVDKIFSLELINKVFELVKKDMKDVGNLINLSNTQIYSLDQTIKTSEEELKGLTGHNSEESKQKLEDIEQKLTKVAELHKQQNELYSTNYTNYVNVCDAEKDVYVLYTNEQNTINQIQQKINLFNEDKCPTCGTPFNSSDFDEIRNNLENELKQHQETLSTYIEQYNSLGVTKKEYVDVLAKINENIRLINEKINQLKLEYNSIQATEKFINESSSIQKIIDSTNESKLKLENSISESNVKMKMLNVMHEMYSADGIKQMMMSNYIPTLNEEIENTLNFLGFPYSLTFDNNFDPTLKDLGIEIKPQSLSIGEHKKVDLTVLCSLLKMIKRKYPQINLVCLDEAVSSLDYESSADIIRYLKEISKNMNLNIFIVSHTQLDENLFDRQLFVEKDNRYSILKEL